MKVPSPVEAAARPRPIAGRARPHRAGEIARQRIVAAGVEDDDRRLALAVDLHLAQHEFELHRLELEVALALELGVDRHQVVLRADLQPVPGVEEQRDVGIGELVGEGPQGAVELAPVGVERLDDLEADGLQGRRHVARVVQRVGERRGALIGAVADDQRDARLGENGAAPPSERAKRNEQSQQPTHRVLPPSPDPGIVAEEAFTCHPRPESGKTDAVRACFQPSACGTRAELRRAGGHCVR